MAKYLKIVVTSVLLFVCLSLSMQAQPYLTVRWTGEWDGKEVPIDSVQVTNLTKDWTTTVFYPEKSIKLYHSVGIMERDFANGQIQVKPNPFSQTATVEFYVGKEGNVLIRLYDVFGRTVASLSQQMECGQQQVVVNVGSSGYYFISVETPTEKRVAKLLSMYDGRGDAGITSSRHCEAQSAEAIQKNTMNTGLLHSVRNDAALNIPPFGGAWGGLPQKSDDLPFDLGDSMQFIGYATDTSGKVHEYLPQSSKILEDKELRFIYNAIPTEDYRLENSDCQWNFSNMQEDSLYIINSEEELLAFITCPDDETPPAIDFTKYTLLLARGTTMYGSIADISKQLMQLSANDYGLNIGLHLSDTAAPQAWQIAVLVPKVNEVKLNLYYPHVSVWVCFFEPLPLWHPDIPITITLTMDTLLSKFYVSTIPHQILTFYKSSFRLSYMFTDSTEGKYLINEDTIRFHGYWLDEWGGDYQYTFIQTMYSSNSMLLYYVPDTGVPQIPEYFYVRDYLFVKQSNF